MKTFAQPRPPSQPAERKKYVKPALERVQLLIEEAVLGSGCKSTSINGYEVPCQGGQNTCDIQGS
jgi:hypothetical protein